MGEAVFKPQIPQPVCVVMWMTLLSHRIQSPALCDGRSFLTTAELGVWLPIFILFFEMWGVSIM